MTERGGLSEKDKKIVFSTRTGVTPKAGQNVRALFDSLVQPDGLSGLGDPALKDIDSQPTSNKTPDDLFAEQKARGKAVYHPQDVKTYPSPKNRQK